MRRRGFTAPELVMVVLLIMVATAVVMAANRRAAGTARDITCMTNLQQLALGLRLYAADHSYGFPRGPRAWDAVYPYVKNKSVFVCPLVRRAGEPEEGLLESDYLLNPTVQTDDLAPLIIMGDDCPDRHAGRWIGVRLDGGVSLLPADEWASRLGEVTEDAEQNE